MGTCLSKQTKKVTVIMLGLDNAGKTTTAKTLVGESPEDVTPTLGFSSFQLKQQRFAVTIYDLGGRSSIRGIWKNYFAEAFGFIFVIDASASSRIQECREVLHTLFKNPIISGKPFLILANKQDIEGAMDEIEICGLLAIEALVNEVKSRTRVENCSAIKTNLKKPDKHVQAGFRWLLTVIGAEYSNLKQKIEQDVDLQKAKEARERQEREERVRILREEREIHQPDTEATPEPQDVNDNPFKPVTVVVKELENKAKSNGIKPELFGKVNQSYSVTEDNTCEVPSISTDPPLSTTSPPVNEVVFDSKSESTRRPSELIQDTPFDVGESRLASSPPSFSIGSNILTPPGSVEIPAEDLPIQSPISHQSTLDDDESESASICNSASSSSHPNLRGGAGSVELGKVAKLRKKKMFFKNNKTAPMTDVQHSLPQREELPPLIFKSGNASPWIALTAIQPPVQPDSHVDSFQLSSNTNMKWNLNEELQVNESQ